MSKLDTTLDQPAQPAATPPIKSLRILGVAAAIMLLLAIGGFAAWWFIPPQLHGVVLQSPRQATNFTLTSSSGEPVQLTDFRGKFVMLYFGYTFCPDVCPMTMGDLTAMSQILGERAMENIEVVLVSVDPERDTPEQLATYLKYFDPSFLGMTGSTEEIQEVASQFGIFFEKQDGSEASGYLVDHTSAITVIDPNGYVRMIFRNDATPEEMAEDMTYLLRRY